MLAKKTLNTAISTALGVGAAGLIAWPVQAQEEQIVEEVVVTGSRIQKTNLVSASPVTQVGAEELQFQGTVRVEDMMRNLPQVYSNQNTGQSNGATGTATLNLRNLGDERTLVLINGRRMPAGSPLEGGIGADINQIPGALIRNVEVLTGGASAAYGSDAVAGVVNFIMMDDFEGVKLDYQFSQYSHHNSDSSIQRVVEESGFPAAKGTKNDGDASDLSIIIGGNFDGGRGNITAYATWRDIDPVKQSERDYSSCALSDDSTSCSGSQTIPEANVTDFGIGDDFDFKVAGDTFVPRDGTSYNYGPENYYQRPDERYTFGMFGRYSMNEHAEVYTEMMFMDDRTLSQIAPSGAFFITNSLPCGNPLLSDQQFNALCGDFGLTKDDVRENTYLGKRNIEGGNRQQDLRHTTFRLVGGLRGDINDTWRYDVYGMYAEVSMENTYMNDLSITNIERALNVVEDDDGNAVCQSVVDGSDPNCIPWNIFSEGAIDQAQLNYLVLPLFARGTTDQTVVSGYLAANLGDYGLTIPWADTGVDVAFGLEYREENLDFNPDNGFRSGDGAGQGGATGPVNGGYDVNEFFIEASVPLVEGRNFAEEVTLDFGYRYSDYSTGHETDTYGIRGGWAVNNSVKLRASFQHAVRAANIQELFLPQGFNLFDMAQDPCATANPQRSAADCARSGVTAGQYGSVPDSPAGQFNFLQGGNPGLEPEEADTYSVGLVWAPEFLEGLSLTVDWYSIEIEKGINNLGPEFILTECLDGNDTLCGEIRRGTAGDLWIGSDVNNSGRIRALNDNLAIEEVEGWDIIAEYDLDMGNFGTLGFSNVMSIIDTWDQQELKGAPTVSCDGGFGAQCGYPTVDFRNNLRATWTTPWDITGSILWRHLSEVEDLNGNNQDLDAMDYFDVAGIWEITEQASIRLGMNNVLDEDPPIAGGAPGSQDNANGNVFPGMYDALGRYWYAAFSVGF